MSEKFNSNPNDWRVEVEVENRNESREKGVQKVKAEDIRAEESEYSSEEKAEAHARTYEVADRLRTAREIDKQRGILEKIGTKVGFVKKTTEKDVAFDEASKENDEIDEKAAREKSTRENLQKEAEERAAEREREEKSARRERNAEIDERMVDIDREIRKTEEDLAKIKEEGRDRLTGATSVIYAVNPDGTENRDPNNRPQNTTGFVESRLTKIAQLKKEKESLAEEHKENRLKNEAS